MKRIVMLAALCAAQVAFAQESADGGVPGRPSEEELFGAPAKPTSQTQMEAQQAAEAKQQQEAVSADAGTPAATERRPTEEELFGTSGGQTPQPGGTTEKRPSEEELFSPGVGTEPPAATAGEALRQGETQEQMGLSGVTVDRFASGEEVENPLQIGALFYQRAIVTNRAGNFARATALSAPTLVDAYFDGRPNDRLRAMIVGRLTYDPAYSPSSLNGQLAGPPRPNPSVALDQLWLNFDILHTVFVTAGRQHVKWGTARFWNPTDYLHNVRRDSLALFDERVGTNMIKLHVPIESNGANLYAMGVLDNPGRAGTLGEVGGAARAEWVIASAEIGVDALVQDGHHPKYGVDMSTALGPFDVYAEASLRPGPVFRWEPNPAMGYGAPALVLHQVTDFGYSIAGGVNWTFAYRENDTATVGAEYFYNPAGYENESLYPLLLLNGQFQPFYVGQNYAALYAVLSGPFDWDNTNFVLSNLGNLSDSSFVTRLDYTVRVLTHLTVEANASVFYGNPNGEFRLRLDVPPLVVNGQQLPAFTLPEQRFQLGVGLRLDI